jgi:hypothetical protein
MNEELVSFDNTLNDTKKKGEKKIDLKGALVQKKVELKI